MVMRGLKGQLNLLRLRFKLIYKEFGGTVLFLSIIFPALMLVLISWVSIAQFGNYLPLLIAVGGVFIGRANRHHLLSEGYRKHSDLIGIILLFAYSLAAFVAWRAGRETFYVVISLGSAICLNKYYWPYGDLAMKIHILNEFLTTDRNEKS